MGTNIELEKCVRLILEIEKNPGGNPETVELCPASREQLQDAVEPDKWYAGKLREDLTPGQRAAIREIAEAQLREDVGGYQLAVETISYLADEAGKGLEFWLETLTSEPDMWPELLGFDPLVREDEGEPDTIAVWSEDAERDTDGEALSRYRHYIEENLERIERGGWTPVCYAEFCESEEYDTYGPVPAGNSPIGEEFPALVNGLSTAFDRFLKGVNDAIERVHDRFEELDEQQRRDEKHGLYGGKGDDSN